MTQVPAPRNRTLAPLAHLAAVILLLEQWTWDFGVRVAAELARLPPLKWLERQVVRLPPYPALLVFVVPGLLLLPVKFLALVAIAHGHAATGIATFVVAKLGGAVVVARIYTLTRPSLLTLAWFARWHNRFVALKDRWIAILRASHVYRRAFHLATRTRRFIRRLLHRLRPKVPFGSRRASHTARVLRRFAAMWRTRNR